MSKNGEITDIDVFLGSILTEESEASVVERATRDQFLRGAFGLFMKHGYHDETERATVRDLLQTRIVRSYNLQPEKAEEVFERVEELVREEMDAHGTT